VIGIVPVLTTTHPVARCVDLRATFGRRFRYVHDPSFAAERPDQRAVEAAWLTRIPCRFGFIAPHGGRQLAAYSTTRRKALASLSGVTVAQGGPGCGEVLVTFDVGDLPAVAALLGALRPPQLSPAEQARRRDRMRAIHASRARETGHVWGQDSTIAAPAVLSSPLSG
jgi:hypothetical protein